MKFQPLILAMALSTTAQASWQSVDIEDDFDDQVSGVAYTSEKSPISNNSRSVVICGPKMPPNISFDFGGFVPLDSDNLVLVRIDKNEAIRLIPTLTTSTKAVFTLNYVGHMIAQMIPGNRLIATTEDALGSPVRLKISLAGFTRSYKNACTGAEGWDSYQKHLGDTQ